METGAVRNYYFGTTQAMMEDLARWHQQRLGEAMTEVVIAARALSGPARLEALSVGLLETLAALADGHRATVAAVHGFPAIAHNVRHGQRWLVAEMAAGLEAAAPCLAGRSLLREVLAETLLMLLEDWSLRLPETEGLSRAGLRAGHGGGGRGCGAGDGGGQPGGLRGAPRGLLPYRVMRILTGMVRTTRIIGRLQPCVVMIGAPEGGRQASAA